MTKTKNKRDVSIYLKDNRYSVEYQGTMYPQSIHYKSETPFSEKLKLAFKDGYVGNIELFITNFIKTGVKEDQLLDFFNVLNKEMSILTKIKKNIKLNIEIDQATIANDNPAIVSSCILYPVTLKIDSIGKEYTFKYYILGYNIIYKNIILDNPTSLPHQDFYNLYVHHGYQVSMINNSIPQIQQPLPHQLVHQMLHNKIARPSTYKQDLINLLKEEISELENDPSNTISREDVYDIIEELFNFKDQLMK